MTMLNNDNLAEELQKLSHHDRQVVETFIVFFEISATKS